MNLRFGLLTFATLAFAGAAFSQTAALDGPFQVRYAANLNIGDSVINITNSGAAESSTNIFDPGGSLCIGVYSFDPSEELLSCCTCTVTPNGLANLSVRAINSTNLTPEVPTSLVIKLLSWNATLGCSASAPGGTTQTLSPGMLAWGATLHAMPGTPTTYAVTETAFSPATLSTTELNHISSFCAFNVANGTGFGVCKGCNPGGAGAVSVQ